MKRIFAGLLVLSMLLPALSASAQRDDDDEGWETIGVSKGVTVATRSKKGSPVDEVKAEGIIEAPPTTVLAILADVEAYTETMPYTRESRLIKREGNQIWAYSVVDPPLASARDYAVRITLLELPGGAYGTKWVPANEVAPPERPGIVRIVDNSGSWTLEPTDGGESTYATYRLHTDPGGKVPKWIINRTNRQSVPDVFEHIRQAADTPRYRDAPNPMVEEGEGGATEPQPSR